MSTYLNETLSNENCLHVKYVYYSELSQKSGFLSVTNRGIVPI